MLNMKIALFGCLLALGAACSSTSDKRSAPVMDPMAEMEAMMKLAEPGEPHEELAMQAGIWQTTMKSYMEPGKPPMVIKGESTMKTIMGGRFLIGRFYSDFMGMPFEGMLIQGFDNLSQEYWTIWVDSMRTDYSVSTGHESADGTLELHGVVKDLRTPAGRPFHSVAKMMSDDTMQFRMYDTASDGSEVLVLEVDYTR